MSHTYLAVCERLRKSIYFLERVHVPERSGIRSCLGETEASLPQTATQNHGFASQPGEGKHPHAQDPKPWFCVAARGGKHPHAQDTKSKYDIHTIRITQTFVFAMLGRGACPPPHATQNNRFALRVGGSWTQKTDFDTNATPEALHLGICMI